MSPLPYPPPALMDFWTAYYYALAGWQIRRWPWRKVNGADASNPTPSDEELQWIRHVPGGFMITGDTFSDRIVTNLDVTRADMIAQDWTVAPPEDTWSNPGNPWTNPNGPIASTISETLGGDPPSTSNPTGGGGAKKPYEPGVTVSNGGGGGGGGNDPPPVNPPRTAPALTVNVLRTGDACWTLDGGNPPLPVPGDKTEPFTGEVSMAPDPAHPGDVYTLLAYKGGSGGMTAFFAGTISPGGTTSLGSFDIVGEAGASYPVTASAHLANPNLNAYGAASGTINPNCDACPVGQHWDITAGGGAGGCVDDDGGGGGGGGGDGGGIYGCTNPSASNYNSLANIDDGSCVFCPEGTHYENGACILD